MFLKIIRIYNNLCIFHELNSQSLVRYICSIILCEFFSICFVVFFFVFTGSYGFDFTFWHGNEMKF